VGVLRILIASVALLLPIAGAPATPDEIAKEILDPLLKPANVDTLKGNRPINARFYKVLGWLETARRADGAVLDVLNKAQEAAGYSGTKRAMADRAAIALARASLDAFGGFTPEGMAELKRGESPTISKGKYKEIGIALDHVLPVSVVPELAARFYNLQVLPTTVNQEKGNRISELTLELARQWNRQGLLSAEGLNAVEAAAR
jgi:hypothetical protein